MSIYNLQLLQLQAGALFTHDGHKRLRVVNEPGGDRAPRFFFARSQEGHLWRCRDDVAGWAHIGRIPLYSTSWDNPVSQAVTRKLGLIQYGVDLSLG